MMRVAGTMASPWVNYVVVIWDQRFLLPRHARPTHGGYPDVFDCGVHTGIASNRCGRPEGHRGGHDCQLAWRYDAA